MHRALILIGFVSLSGGCGPGEPPAASPVGPTAREVLPPSRVEATGCRAAPSTVYGDEPVVFEVQAPSPTQVDVELFDARAESVERAVVSAPGAFRPRQVPSGDFVLELSGPARLACSVTVNRELPRAIQAKR